MKRGLILSRTQIESFMERVGRKPVFKFATGLPYLGKRSGQLNVRLKTAICDGRVRDFL